MIRMRTAETKTYGNPYYFYVRAHPKPLAQTRDENWSRYAEPYRRNT